MTETQKAVRRMMVRWVRANAPIVEKNLLTSFDNAARFGLNSTFAISRELTKQREPALLSCYGGELFIFYLTQRQAKAYHATKQSMHCVEGSRSLEIRPDVTPMFDVGELEFDDADGLPAEKEIRGRLTYEQNEGVEYPGTICLAMEYTLGDHRRATKYYYPPAGLLPEGKIAFTFHAMEFGQAPGHSLFSGPTVAHVRLVGTMDAKSHDGQHVPLSNTCAALLQVI